MPLKPSQHSHSSGSAKQTTLDLLVNVPSKLLTYLGTTERTSDELRTRGTEGKWREEKGKSRRWHRVTAGPGLTHMGSSEEGLLQQSSGETATQSQSEGCPRPEQL